MRPGIGWRTGARAGIAAIVLCLCACGGSKNSSGAATAPLSPTAPGSTSTGPFAFHASPVAVDQIRFIVPLGSLNPPAHTLPTDHIYFYVADPSAGEQPLSRRTDFFAPADGVVMAVIDNGIGADRKVLINGTSRIYMDIDHLIPAAALTPGTQVKAGDRLGTTGSSYGIDLGIINQDITLTGLLNLARYSSGAEHTDAPLKYFDEPLRSQLYAKVQTIGDRDGKFDDDIAGRLSGNWFGATNQGAGAFAYDTYDPSQIRISLGDGFSLPPGVFGIAPGEPSHRDVSTASGPVRYTLVRGSSRLGQMLVQMLDDQRIRVEVSADAVGDFGPRAVILSR